MITLPNHTSLHVMSITGQVTLIVYSLCCQITIKWSTNALYYISFIVKETHFLLTLLFCFCFTLIHLFHSFLFKLSKPFPWPPKENWTDLPQNLKKVKCQDHQYRKLQPRPFPHLLILYKYLSTGLRITLLLVVGLIPLNIAHYHTLIFLTTISSCLKILRLSLHSSNQLSVSCWILVLFLTLFWWKSFIVTYHSLWLMAFRHWEVLLKAKRLLSLKPESMIF